MQDDTYVIFGLVKSFLMLFFNPPTHLNPFVERTEKTVRIIERSLIVMGVIGTLK